MNATTILYSSWDSNLVGYDGVVLKLQFEGSLDTLLLLLHWWMVMFFGANKIFMIRKLQTKTRNI